MALTRVPFDLMKDAIQWSEQIASLTVANVDAVEPSIINNCNY